MNRISHIKSKLEYAESLRQDLMSLLFSAKFDNVETDPILHLARTLLSETRECFDYCARDIIENFVLADQVSKKRGYGEKEVKIYFPFFTKQLQKDIFLELKEKQEVLYNHLYSLTEKMINDEAIPRTLFKYGAILDLREMINEKKHDKLIAVTADLKKEILIKQETFHAVFSINKNPDINWISVPQNCVLKKVDEFRFEYNNWEISDFCMHSVMITRIILNEIYTNFFKEKLL